MNLQETMEVIRDRIIERRKELGLGVKKLSELMGWTRQQVYNVENGKSGITIAFAHDACLSLRMDFKELFQGVGPQKCRKRSPKRNQCVLMAGHDGMHESEVGERWL